MISTIRPIIICLYKVNVKSRGCHLERLKKGEFFFFCHGTCIFTRADVSLCKQSVTIFDRVREKQTVEWESMDVTIVSEADCQEVKRVTVTFVSRTQFLETLAAWRLVSPPLELDGLL